MMHEQAFNSKESLVPVGLGYKHSWKQRKLYIRKWDDFAPSLYI